MLFRGPHVCPTCGEQVSAYAAGCAICGTALDPRRGQTPPPRRAKLSAGLRDVVRRATRARHL